MKKCQFRWVQVNTDRKKIEQYVFTEDSLELERGFGTASMVWELLRRQISELFLHGTGTEILTSE